MDYGAKVVGNTQLYVLVQIYMVICLNLPVIRALATSNIAWVRS